MDDLEPSASAYPLLALVDQPSVIRDFSASELDQLADDVMSYSAAIARAITTSNGKR